MGGKNRKFRVPRGGKLSPDSESPRNLLQKSGLASHFGPQKCDFASRGGGPLPEVLTVPSGIRARSDPYEKIGLRGMGVTKPYNFIWFRDTHATEPYFFIGIGACKIFSVNSIGFAVGAAVPHAVREHA